MVIPEALIDDIMQVPRILTEKPTWEPPLVGYVGFKVGPKGNYPFCPHFETLSFETHLCVCFFEAALLKVGLKPFLASPILTSI